MSRCRRFVCPMCAAWRAVAHPTHARLATHHCILAAVQRRLPEQPTSGCPVCDNVPGGAVSERAGGLGCAGERKVACVGHHAAVLGCD